MLHFLVVLRWYTSINPGGGGGGGGAGGILLVTIYLYWINEFRTTKDWHDLRSSYDETYLVNLGPEQIYVLRDRWLKYAIFGTRKMESEYLALTLTT